VTPETDAIFEDALKVMSDAGATLVDVTIPSFDEFNADQSEIIVLIFEFKRDLNAYLATRSGVPVSTLADVIQFNLDHADEELKFFGQELMELAEAEIFTEAEYQQALIRGPQLAGPQGIDATLAANNVQAIIAPTNTPAWPTDLINGDAFLFGSSGFAAVAGYPLVTVTGGFAFDLPVGITFMASAWSEPTLIKLASGFEAAAKVSRRPKFLRTFNPDGKSHGHNKGRTMEALAARSASSASSVMQRHAARLDPFLVPRLRKPTYL
jgi:amidase